MTNLTAEQNAFLTETAERGDLNQYWFSTGTITAFVAEILETGGCAALVSSPSIYFSLPRSARDGCRVFDIDRQWESDPGYVHYDFNNPEVIPADCMHAFDFVLVDPPFVTRDVWAQYATTTRLLLRDGGRVLCTTIAENAAMMEEMLQLQPVLFRPSIPSLTYQYSLYVNYDSLRLKTLNPEVDSEDWRPAANSSCSSASREPQGPLRSASEPVPAQRSQTEAIPKPSHTVDAEEQPAGLALPLPLPPGAQLVVQLRDLVNALKSALQGLNLLFQPSLRAKAAPGTKCLEPRAASALESAAAAADALESWATGHTAELSEALGELAWEASRERWHTEGPRDLLNRARGLCLAGGPEAHKSYMLLSKQHAAALFRLSSKLLDRIKALKQGGQVAMQDAGTTGSALDRDLL